MPEPDDSLARVRAAFTPPGVEPSRVGAPPGVSAVLLPLFLEPSGGLSLLFTRRASTLRSHPGEVSFPGGRVDATDESPRAAALREAHEEVGIEPSEVDVLGHLTDFVTHHNVLVCAYVGIVARPAPTVPRSREEVADVFTVPIARLLDAKTWEGRAFAEFPERVVHYFHVQPRAVWGITGELTARFLHKAFAWKPPAAPRFIARVEEFRP